jgi:hypothetical protein
LLSARFPPHPGDPICVKVIFPVTGEVHDDLARTHIDFKLGQQEIADFQVTLPGTHINLELHGYIVSQAKIPLVVRTANVELSPRLDLDPAQLPV